VDIHIIGGGLAGSEAAWQASRQIKHIKGARVILHEMRPHQKTAAHQGEGLAELVCSNSFRSDDAQNNAVGLLHEEMRRCDSLIMHAADAHQVPAGGALAVDREAFSDAVTKALEDVPNLVIEREEVKTLPPAEWDNVIIATGPLTSAPLAQAVQTLTDEDELAFFDAIAPIVYKESIDFDKAWFQSRYDKKGPGGDGADYINCPLDKEQYHAFINALIEGEKTEFKEWEKDTPYFEACLPIEVMAERGIETLRYGPMKPVGLTNPHQSEKPYAVVQLRQDNKLGSLYNMVGFQTKLKYGAQAEIFRMIPGLEKAEFARLGGIHRNTFLNSPKLLDETLRLKAMPRLRFAGQITGVEGYVESAAIGLLCGRFAAGDLIGNKFVAPPLQTALGALLNHITQGHQDHGNQAVAIAKSSARAFQPMNVNFGLFPEMKAPRTDENGKRVKGKERGRLKKQLMCNRALEVMAQWQEPDVANSK